MTCDGLSALKIEYNCLNLTGVAKDMSDNVKATYLWLADGTKAGVKDVAGTLGYEYMGSLVYHYVNGELQLEGAAFGGGRIMVAQGSSGATYTPNYFIADHLGSTRVIYDPAASAGSQIVARYDYMPFGQSRNATGLASINRYKFSGKEEQTTGNLRFFDFGARFYNSRIGRWNGIDPLAGDYASVSPFNYCLNNPLKFVDPKGEEIYNYDIAHYLDKTGYFGQGTINNDMMRMVGGFEVSPYLNADGKIIGWSAYRNGRIQYVMDSPDDIGRFTDNAGTYSLAADFFYQNGTPSEGMIAMIAGDYAKGLGMQWKEALTDPGYYFYLANVAGAVAMNLPRDLKYAPRVDVRAAQDPVSHKFPYSFDQTILSQKPKVMQSGYKIYQAPGFMNGKSGVYEIGRNANGIIDHRFFRPLK